MGFGGKRKDPPSNRQLPGTRMVNGTPTYTILSGEGWNEFVTGKGEPVPGRHSARIPVHKDDPDQQKRNIAILAKTVHGIHGVEISKRPVRGHWVVVFRFKSNLGERRLYEIGLELYALFG